MSCIATLVRADNASAFEDDAPAHGPELLVEPLPLDTAILADGRTWVRVYADGSALDDRGRVHTHAPNAARDLRFDLPEAA